MRDNFLNPKFRFGHFKGRTFGPALQNFGRGLAQMSARTFHLKSHSPINFAEESPQIKNDELKSKMLLGNE